ncbi:sensor histidine kinase, partial [Chloroflexota bacterium]
IEKVREMSSLVDDTISKVQRIATELRPGILDDLGIIAALEYAVAEFQQRSGIKCRLNAESEDLVLDPEIATEVFRIFQEALTNVSRHAEATSVSVILKRKDNRLVMQLKDNGVGIREEQVSGKHSFGLMGMRERANLAGGQFQIKGIPGKGTTITLSIPLDG